MSIVQTFYDDMATLYDKLFADWQQTTHEQAPILDLLFQMNLMFHWMWKRTLFHFVVIVIIKFIMERMPMCYLENCMKNVKMHWQVQV